MLVVASHATAATSLTYVYDANSWTLPFNAYLRDVRDQCDGDAPNVEQTFFDMNGEGLPDIINPVANVSDWEVWYNTGRDLQVSRLGLFLQM